MVLGLDTSAIDGFADAPDSSRLLERLHRTWRVVIPFEVAGEILACPDPARRDFLLATARDLLAAGHVALPAAEGMKKLLYRYNNSRTIAPSRYRPFFPKSDTEGILSMPADVGAAQLRDNVESESTFRQIFSSAVPKLQKAARQNRPADAMELAVWLERGGALRQMEIDICARAGLANPTAARVRRFRRECPSLRALGMALIAVPEFEYAFRKNGESARAGRNDSLMACLLPYCDAFVTRDERQRECLSQVKQLAQIKAQVLGFDHFAARLRA